MSGCRCLFAASKPLSRQLGAQVGANVADTKRVSENSFGANTALVPRYRRVGLRMSCWSCEVAWTGAVESRCWVCEGPGVPGPPPSIYPDID